MDNSTYLDDALEDERNEHRAARAQMAKESHIPLATETHVPRFFKGLDEGDGACDTFYVDRLTGHEVMRYDAADPANTNPYYGAESDGSCMAKKGYQIGEMIRRDQVVISDDDLRAMCRQRDDYDDYDDYGDDDYDDSWDDPDTDEPEDDVDEL